MTDTITGTLIWNCDVCGKPVADGKGYVCVDVSAADGFRPAYDEYGNRHAAGDAAGYHRAEHHSGRGALARLPQAVRPDESQPERLLVRRRAGAHRSRPTGLDSASVQQGLVPRHQLGRVPLRRHERERWATPAMTRIHDVSITADGLYRITLFADNGSHVIELDRENALRFAALLKAACE